MVPNFTDEDKMGKKEILLRKQTLVDQGEKRKTQVQDCTRHNETSMVLKNLRKAVSLPQMGKTTSLNDRVQSIHSEVNPRAIRVTFKLAR